MGIEPHAEQTDIPKPELLYNQHFTNVALSPTFNFSFRSFVHLMKSKPIQFFL